MEKKNGSLQNLNLGNLWEIEKSSKLIQGSLSWVGVN